MMNTIDSNMNVFNTHMGYSSLLPLSGTTTTETLLPPPYNSIVADSFPHKTTIKSNSNLSYSNANVAFSRKRSRENSNSISFPYVSYPSATISASLPHKSCGNSFSFLGEDISLQIQQQQLDIDHLIAQRMEKVRMELEERRKKQARRIIEAIEIGVMKKLKAKEDEIEKIGKLNWALEERVKSLCIENQIWRDLAQTNEATANALRTNLEQVLAQRGRVDDDGATVCPAGAVMDDAESCCDSTGKEGEKGEVEEKGYWSTLAGNGEGAQDKKGEGAQDKKRMCRSCEKEESCVLILPCRHLCLCTVCESTLHTCPICKSFKTASVQVNMS